MSSAKLKTIVIDPSDSLLTIQGGTVLLSNTTFSTSSSTGSCVFNGGISINGTDASSATNGGSLTINGGLGMSGKLFTGNSVVHSGDNTFDITSRVSVGKTTDELITFKPNGSSNTLRLLGNSVIFDSTTPSTSSTSASAVFFGGITVSQTSNSISSTEGGSLSVKGGVSLGKDLRIGNRIIMDYNDVTGGIHIKTSGGTLNTINNSVENLVVTGSTGVNIVSSLIKLGSSLSGTVIVGSSGITVGSSVTTTFNNTTVATNGTTGSVIVKGGIVSESIYNNGNYTGVNVGISGTIGVSASTDSTKVVLYETSGSFTRFSTVSSGTLVTDAVSSGSFIWKSGDTPVFELSSSGTLLVQESGQNYAIRSKSSSLNFQGKGVGTGSSYSFYTNDGDNGDDNSLKVYSLGTPDSTVNTEYLGISWENGNSRYKISTNKTGTGVLRNLLIQNLTFFTSGNCQLSAGSLTVDGGLTVNNGANVLSNATVGGNLTVSGSKIQFNTIDLTVTNGALVITNGSLVISNVSPELSLYNSGLNGTGTESNLTLSSSSLYTRSSGGGTLSNLSIYTGLITNQLYLATSGNIGVNTTNASATLTVNGDLTCTNASISSLSLGTGSLVINNTTDTNSLTSGSLYTFGGVGIAKSLYVGNTVTSTVIYTSTGSIGTLSSNVSSIGTLRTTRITTGNLLVSDTTLASGVPGSTVGSAVINGGVSIRQNLLVNNYSILNGTSTYTVDNGVIYFNTTDNVKRLSLNRSNPSHDFQVSRYDDTEVLIDNPLVITHTTGNLSLNFSTINGILVSNTSDASGIGTGGSVTVLGGLAVSKKVYLGNTVITATTESTNSSNGSLQVKGGLGVLGNVFLEKDLTVNGNFTVNGTSNLINSTDIEIENNTMTLNGGPTSSRDAGLFIKRYQTINDTGVGDVVTDTEYTTFTLPSQSGMTTTQIKLPVTASSNDDEYTGWYIKVTSGFSANQVRLISSYNGSSKVAVTSTAWTTQNPALSDTVNLYNSVYTGFVFNEVDKEFDFVTSTNDTYSNTITTTGFIPLKARKLTLNDTSGSNSITSGSVITEGGITIKNTSDASGNTIGGTLLSLGGAAFAKKVYVGSLYISGTQFGLNTGDINIVTSFSGGNNVGTPTDVTGLLFAGSVTSADIFLSVVITATTNLYANFHIRLINKGTLWDITESYLGDETGLSFTITTGGQIQYTSGTYAGFSTMNIKFRALVT
jgi:hypothetical protein